MESLLEILQSGKSELETMVAHGHVSAAGNLDSLFLILSRTLERRWFYAQYNFIAQAFSHISNSVNKKYENEIMLIFTTFVPKISSLLFHHYLFFKFQAEQFKLV